MFIMVILAIESLYEFVSLFSGTKIIKKLNDNAGMSFCGKIEGWFLGWVKAGICPEKKVCGGLLWLPIILYPGWTE